MKKVIPFSKTVHFKTMIAEVTDIEVKHTLKATANQTIEGDILVDGTYKMTEASQIEEEFHYTLPFTIEVDEKYDIESADIGIHDFYFEIINEEDLKINVELEISQVEEKKELEEISTEQLVEPISAEELEETEKILEKTRLEQGEIKPPAKQVELLDDVDLNMISDTEKKDWDEEELEKEKEIEVVNKEIVSTQPTPSITIENTAIDLTQEITTQEPSTETQSSTNVPSIFSSISQEETFVTYYVYIVREQDTIESIIEKYKSNRDDLAIYNDLSQIKPGSKLIIPCSNE